MEIAAAAGETALQKAGAPSLDVAAKLRLSAYVQQARQYYEAAIRAEPIAKPLLGYYFVLNATKAYLTLLNHPNTATPGIKHGIGQDNSHLTGQYEFSQEYLQIQTSGVFHLLAGNSGRGHVWGAGVMQVSRLIPYLNESVDLYASAFNKRPLLIPIEDTFIRASGKRPNRFAWLVVEVSRLALREADLSPRKLLDEAAAFAGSFDHVESDRDDVVRYESKVPVPYSAMPLALPGLRQAFDRSLISRNRTLAQPRDNIVRSPHLELISAEALTFAVMLHLSNMVRYRPHHVEQLRGSSQWWLFTSWVDRACENFLLAMSSRVSLEEHLIE
ncbi:MULTISPECIES: YaaC family protein [unclassified Microbacterium]|uniref:YaaC family protein n=1 Tax=unclassified Microbacterium TaxID=2609290 RepID=UPI0015A2AF66|nr:MULTISPECIES: YaaC family protein [unclassified Microbacterium]